MEDPTPEPGIAASNGKRVRTDQAQSTLAPNPHDESPLRHTLEYEM